MPVNFMPPPGQPGYAPNTSIGLHGASPMPQAADGSALGGANAALQGLAKAYMMAKMRKPPVPGTPAVPPSAQQPGWLGAGTGGTPGAGDPSAFAGGLS